MENLHFTKKSRDSKAWASDGSDFDLTIFISSYNEENYIIDTINNVIQALTILSINYEIIIIDDCSTDNSVKVIKSYLNDHPDFMITLLENKINRGLGRNYLEGAIRGHGTYYRLVCGDNVEPVETLLKIFSLLGKSEIIIPYHEFITGKSFSRQYLSKIYTLICNKLSGNNIKYYNGLAIIKRLDVLRFSPVTSGFGFQADILTNMLNFKRKFIQVPVLMSEVKPSKALNLNNFLSSLHVFFIILIRRLSFLYHNLRK